MGDQTKFPLTARAAVLHFAHEAVPPILGIYALRLSGVDSVTTTNLRAPLPKTL